MGNRPNLLLTVLGAIIAATGGLTAVELREDPPVARPPKAGDITGTMTPAEKVDTLRAVSRATGKSYLPNEFDRKTGRFAFKGLSGDARYDLCALTKDGRDYQGIDLDFVDARMLRLAALRRKQLGLPPERSHTFNADDVKWLVKFVKDQRTFTHIHRPIYIKGHGRRATVLLELIRTRPFVKSQGKMVWRMELWYFDYQFGGWEKVANQERVLERKRILPAQWRKIHIEYYPQLSAYVDEGGQGKPVAFRIPDKADPSRGRAAGTKPEIETRLHVLGLTARGAGD